MSDSKSQPTTVRHLVARLRAWLRGGDLDREFAEELQSHLDLATDDYIRRGMAPEDARRAAARRLGGTTSIQQQHRDERAAPFLDSLSQDLKFVFRALGSDRWFSATVVGILALGIGANTLGFTIVNAAFLRGLPFEDSARLHMISWIDGDGRRDPVSHPELGDWRAQSRAFESLAGYEDRDASLSDDRALPERVRATRVTADAFRVLRVRPYLGRDFISGDEQPAADRVVVLSHHLWRNRYGADAGILGVPVRIDGAAATVIGVMPEGMLFPDRSDLWQPFVPAGDGARDARRLEVIGRLREDANHRQAQAEFDGIARALKAAYPATLADINGARVETVPEASIGGSGRRLFLTVMAAVVLVLVIAAANVANLLLLRSAARAREMALRAAMGATRARLVRQLLLESLVLALAGAAAGLALAQGAVQVFSAAMTAGGLPFWVEFSIDYVVFGYVAVLAVVTALAFGLSPALQVWRADQNEVLKDGGRGSIGAPRVRRFATGMVIIELSVAIALLGGAGLLVRSFAALYSADLGVNVDPLVTMNVELRAETYADAARRRLFFAELEPRLAAIPGVAAAAVTTGVPSRDGGERLLEIEGAPADARAVFVSTVAMTPSYFDTIGVSLHRGRNFTPADGAPGAETAIVNQRLAAQFFAGRDPIGRRLRFARRQPAPGQPPDVWRTIVGIAPDVSHGSPQDGYLNATVYLPYREEARALASLLVRSNLEPATIIRAVRREVQAVDPDLPIVQPQTVADILEQDRWIYRVFGGMFAAFAAIAVLLSAAALYTIVAYSVTERTAEFGVRVALGANRRTIVWLVLRRGLKQLAAGIVFGLAGAFVLGDVLSGMLVGVSATDPMTFAAITLTLSAVAIGACLRPAIRAGRVDPMIALRTE